MGEDIITGVGIFAFLGMSMYFLILIIAYEDTSKQLKQEEEQNASLEAMCGKLIIENFDLKKKVDQLTKENLLLRQEYHNQQEYIYFEDDELQ